MILILLLIYLQIVLGAFLAGLDGGLVYNTWPDMNGNFFPDDTSFLIFLSNDFLSTPSVIQFIHRITSYFLLILVFQILYKYFF